MNLFDDLSECTSLPLRFNAFNDNYHSHAGSVLIVASGPTANSFPLARYAQVPVIAMNGSILKCEAEGVRPLYYICDDVSFIDKRPQLALKGLRQAQQLAMNVECYARLHQLEPRELEGARLYCLQRVNRQQHRPLMSDRLFAWRIRNDPYLHSEFSLLHIKPNRIGFSTHLGRGYFGSRTIPLAALQLACHLGFQRAFLVGVDLNPNAGRFYEQGASALPSTLDGDYQDYILPSFRLMRERVVRPGQFEVFNLSNDSRLPRDIVPRLSVEELDARL